MLELFVHYRVMRRMFYAVLLLLVYWRLPELLLVLKGQ